MEPDPILKTGSEVLEFEKNAKAKIMGFENWRTRLKPGLKSGEKNNFKYQNKDQL